MNFFSQPRDRFATLPTPLEFLPRLTDKLGGPRIYIKRDDLTGLAFGGNKTRQLEYVFADILAKGADTVIGPQVALSAGMAPGQTCITDPVVTIGDRCLIGRGSGIVGHLSIEIGNDVYTGHYVYITDQNHGYADRDLPISMQTMPERPVRIGDGSWIGHGSVVLPGADIGRNVVIGANSVVRGTIPDFSVAAGVPAKVVKQF